MKWFSENVKFWNITFSRRPLKIFSYNAQMKAEDMLHQSVVVHQPLVVYLTGYKVTNVANSAYWPLQGFYAANKVKMTPEQICPSDA